MCQMEPKTHAATNGEELYHQYCSSCHILPALYDLDKKSWQTHVLPRMGAFMGIYSAGFRRDSLIENEAVEKANIFPSEPIITQEEWQSIQEYVLTGAPTQLKESDLVISDTLRNFDIKFPNIYKSPPSTTYVEISNGHLYFADVHSRQLIMTDKNLKPKAVLNFPQEGIVHRMAVDNAEYITIMGSFSPTDDATGQIIKVTVNGQIQTLISDLQRPVHSSYANMDHDEDLEIIVSEFGKWTGALSYWDKDSKGNYQRKNIVSRSGAIKTQLLDYDRDGLMDVMALFGQGDEGIQVYINQGNGNFDSKSLIRFSPSYGSANILLYDLNADGLEDIIYCAGDNADFGPVVRPYHGIYIYEQQEDHSYKESQFLALPGAYAALPIRNNEGNIDIAAISFFPDYDHNSQQSFVFFMFDKGVYSRQVLPRADLGRWIVMDTGDLDNDGDQDIVLGSLAFDAPGHGQKVDEWIQNGLPFIVLNNQANPTQK